jgi:hypothetical protein
MTAVAGAAVALFGVSAGPAAASTATARAPVISRITLGPDASGYTALPKSGSGGATGFSRIQGTFVVPSFTCTQTPDSTASFEIGLDGITTTKYPDGTYELVGVSEQCFKGARLYSAWYQLGGLSQQFEFHPQPGDTIESSVKDVTGKYKFFMYDQTSGQTFSAAQTCSTCGDISAEVMVPGGPADFGTVDFSNIVVTDSSGDAPGGLANSHWTTLRLVQSGWPHSAAGPLHTFPSPPHSAFADKWG